MNNKQATELLAKLTTLAYLVESAGASPELTHISNVVQDLKADVNVVTNVVTLGYGTEQPATEKVRARFVCQRISQLAGGYVEVQLQAVYGAGDGNKDFAEATPQGTLTMMIGPGRKAAKFFEPGKAYLLDFTGEAAKLLAE